MSSPVATLAPIHSAVVRRQSQRRAPSLLVSAAALRRLVRPFVTPADVEQIFREAQRIYR